MLAGAEDVPERAFFGRTAYPAIPKDWLRHERDRIAACLRARADRSQPRPEDGLPELREVKVVEDEVVWRSEFSPDANALLVEGFLSRWRPAA